MPQDLLKARASAFASCAGIGGQQSTQWCPAQDTLAGTINIVEDERSMAVLA
jgi:hypothetical protein